MESASLTLFFGIAGFAPEYLMSSSEDKQSPAVEKTTSTGPGAVEEAEEPTVVFRKVAPNKKNLKKRVHDDTATEEEEAVQITKKSKQGSVGLVDDAAESGSGVSVMEGTSFGFSYDSTGSRQLGVGDSAVTQSHMEAGEREDGNKSAATNNGTLGPDGKQVYTGQAGYTQYVKQSKYSGPTRTKSHIRADVRMDYARDICKDFKETGYCGYGDACKFLHDRSDYKAGWQMEKEWELDELKKRKAMADTFSKRSGVASSSDDGQKTDDVTEDGLKVSSKNSQDLPFACYICRKPFIQPVVTKCGHYFCQDCALQRHAKDKTCAVCKEPTGGSFNSALRILKRRDELAKLNGGADSSPVPAKS